MIEDLLEKLVRDKIKKMSLTDKMTSYLVHKKKRGTYQAVKESTEIEIDISSKVYQFTKEWLTNEIINGFTKKALDKEINSQVELELVSRGFGKINI